MIVRIAAILGSTVFPAMAAAAEIHGAGATFPAPVYEAWAAAYEQSSGIDIRYDAIGSGAGIERVRRHEVDFGASDAPLEPQELAQAGLLQFPVVIGGVVPVVNISGIAPGGLTLDGEVLAQIYAGTIRRWNAAPIAALNPRTKLPPANITVVHRNDASGSTLLWTDYLAHTSVTWRATIGSGLTVAWPTGVGGDGNEGVASYVQRTRFAIGYVEYAFARKHHLSDASLINHDGKIVQARRETFQAAAQAAVWSDIATFRQLPTDLPGAATWPITGASFILFAVDPKHSEHTREAVRFFEWSLQHGAAITQSLDYVELPAAAALQLPDFWPKKERGSADGMLPR